jgi:hypothetical protein
VILESDRFYQRLVFEEKHWNDSWSKHYMSAKFFKSRAPASWLFSG